MLTALVEVLISVVESVVSAVVAVVNVDPEIAPPCASLVISFVEGWRAVVDSKCVVVAVVLALGSVVAAVDAEKMLSIKYCPAKLTACRTC